MNEMQIFAVSVFNFYSIIYLSPCKFYCSKNF
jgi:hypothetical protein